MNPTSAARLLHIKLMEVFVMAQPLRRDTFAPEPHRVPAAAPSDSPARQAFLVLYFGFIAEVLAGTSWR